MFNGLAVVSLVLCVVALTVWIRRVTFGVPHHPAELYRGTRLKLLSYDSGIDVEWHPPIESAELFPDMKSYYEWEATPRSRRYYHIWRFEVGELEGLDRLSDGRVRYKGKAIYALSPEWPLVIGFACLPGGVLMSGVFRNRRNRKPGHCVRCGYDLRATPDRCPECGTMQAKREISI
jgi:hypothetical protein